MGFMMALFHFSLSLIKRSAGRSIVAAAAYRSASRISDERTGEVHDYFRKSNVEYSEIIAPDDAPTWVFDRSKLWNAVEAGELRRDAQLAREFEASLPRELTDREQRQLVQSFVKDEFISLGMIADLSFHRPLAGDGMEQPHVHGLLTLRRISASGLGPKVRAWNDPALAETWRARWADHVNQALAKKGVSERVDHRSYKRQGVDLEPTAHMGPYATQFERRARVRAQRRGEPYRPVSRIATDNASRMKRNALRSTNHRAIALAKFTTQATGNLLNEVARQLSETIESGDRSEAELSDHRQGYRGNREMTR